MKDTVELEKAVIEKIEDDILVTKYKHGHIVEFDDAVEIDNTHYEMCNGKEVFTIVDMGGIENKVSKKAQEYYTLKAKMIPNIKAVGLVMDGISNRLMSKFYMRLYKPYYPTKIFSSRKRAIKWFDEMREEN